MIASNSTKIHTRTGVIDPFNARESDIVIEDIAHALANTCRFGGATSTFYSVAEHSIRVAERVSPNLRLCALLHDAAEAYLGDIPTPIKQCMQFRRADSEGVTTESYAAAENRLLAVIFARLHVGYKWIPSEVHEADKIARLEEERRYIRGAGYFGHTMEPAEAGGAFLDRFREYSRQGVTV